jgi:hypothetical protein
MSRCLLDLVSGHAFDAAGRFTPVPRAEWDKSTAEARRVRTHVRRALLNGDRTGAEFVLCYHVEGDHHWYLEWSENRNQESAVEAVKKYLKYGMPWL